MDHQQLVDALTGPAHRKTEAMIQSSVRELLRDGPFDLGDDQVVLLESKVGQADRIDVEVGSTVVEVKRKLDTPASVTKASAQLCKYVTERQDTRGTRTVGLLTDGMHWSAWHLPAGAEELIQVGTFELTDGATADDLDRLCVWLDGFLATAQNLTPTPDEVELRLGAGSSSTRLDLASLEALLDVAADQPDVALKRQLWRRLLTIAFGDGLDETDDTALFLEHTYLVVLATLIGHAVIGYDVRHQAPKDLLRGRLFTDAGVYGVIEQDFFDWVGDVDGGLDWVGQLARRIGRFNWSKVDHDVLKVLYESVIGTDTRHRLGEYYTPDWLARLVVDDVVDDPGSQRVLDPACGSGTFVFWTVRAVVDAAVAAGTDNRTVIADVTSRVFGMDVHPVAVTLARITYLLALGRERLAGDRGPFSVPVFLGDAVQFEQAEGALWSADGLVVHVADEQDTGQASMFAQHLHLPQRVIDDVGSFDQLVAELTAAASDRTTGSKPPSVRPVLDRYGVHPDDRAAVTATFEVLCRLNDDGRNHIWGYYLRNLARPRWLAQPANRVDRIVGNPPWLSYRHMPDAMQRRFKTLASGRGLWSGGKVATQQDLAALFVVRACELYLNVGGRFGMVVPFATLSRQAYEGFRSGRWTQATEGTVDAFTTAHLDRPWSLTGVTPDIFPVPSAVVFGSRAPQRYTPMPPTMLEWSGTLAAGTDPAVALTRTAVARVEAPGAGADWSPYRTRFRQGATIVPRMLTVVERVPAGPLGSVAGRADVRSRRTSQEKPPWKGLPPLTGQVEERFLRPMHLGATVLPFRMDTPWTAVVPWDGTDLLDHDHPNLARYPGLAGWVGQAQRVWEQHRATKSPGTVVERMNYQRGLVSQFRDMHRLRVVYATSGSALAAATVDDPRADDPRAVIDNSLYWATAASMDEARYLTAVLNAPVTTARVAPLQSVGAFGPRHFHKWVWALPIPHYDSHNPLHVDLASEAAAAEQVAAAVNIDGIGYPNNRKVIRRALETDGVLGRINDLVDQLLLETVAGT